MKLKNPIMLGGALALALALPATHTVADDWPTWGGTKDRNMVSPVTGLPDEFHPGERLAGSEDIDMSTTKNARWVIKLGSQSYGSATVAGGRVFVGTNNESPRDERQIGDRGVVMAFDEQTGEFLWQLVSPKLGAGKVSDWEYLGICSAPTVVGDVGYVITNRCEVVALDLKGMANGNTGPFTDEAGYSGQEGLEPVEPIETTADIIWVYDMRSDLGVFPHNIASSYVLHVDGKLFVCTSNGVDWSHTNIPAPQAPTLICLDAETGELIAEMDPIISERCLHASWSSPAYAEVEGTPMVFFGGGDGWLYGLSLDYEEDEEGFNILKEYWRYDANPPEYRFDEDGNPIRYIEYDGPSEIITTSVYHDGLVYTAIGQDPEHGEGLGMISAIDPTKRGDISGQAVWTNQDVNRSISTPAVHEGLLYIADYSGRLFCLDAKTGEEYWRYDTRGHIWASPLVADGKVYIGTEEGELYILEASREMNKLNMVEFPAPIYAGPVAANGTLYVQTMTHLYAFQAGVEPVVTTTSAVTE